MPFLQTNTITFHYADKGQGVPFIFQHGLGGDTHQTQDVFQNPLPFRIISLDCRGHGETSPVGDAAALSFNQYADDVIALMDHLQLSKVVIGGISMGAGVALNFGLRYPERALALVLVRPAWLCEPLPPNLCVYPRIANLIRRYGVLKGADAFKQSEAYQSVLRSFPNSASSLTKQFERKYAQDFVDILERLPLDAPNGTMSEWGRIQVPTLILANYYDPVHPFGYGETLAQAIKVAQFQEITSKEIDLRQHQDDMRLAIEQFIAANS